MNTINFERTDMGQGRTHVFIGTILKEHGVEMNIDLSGPDAATEVVTADMMKFLESQIPEVVVASKPAKKSRKKEAT